MAKTLNVGVIGMGFMGRAHSNAYRKVTNFFPLDIHPVLKTICAMEPPEKLQAFADTWGYESIETDWRKLIERKDIDQIDICTPNATHKEIVLAAAAAGKSIICEKPLAMTVAEAEEMVAAVEKAGVPNLVCFNYRRVPAISLAKQLIDEGRIGRPFHYRATYLQDWTISADVPQGGAALWRLDAKTAGSGVTGDLLAHSIDTAEWLNGPIQSVVAKTETFVKQRKHQETGKLEPVTIDDACMFLAVFANGSMGTFESTRYARGRKNYNTFELNGEAGSVFFDLEDPQYLRLLPLHRPGHRQEGGRPPHRLAAGACHQPRASLHEEVVGARVHDRLRTHVRPHRGRLPAGDRDRQAGPARLPLRTPHPESVRRGPGQRQERQVGRNRLTTA